MMRATMVVTLVVAGFLAVPAAQTGRSKTTPLALESLAGRDSFELYCASCHGADGRGGGPVAGALRTRPADLTTLAQRSGGKFSREQVAAFIEGTSRRVPAHGSTDMPVWGTTFRGLETSDARVRVRLANLVAYVESLQVPASQAAQKPPAQASGAQLFRTYCASCHGENARGSGPMVGQLNKRQLLLADVVQLRAVQIHDGQRWFHRGAPR